MWQSLLDLDRELLLALNGDGGAFWDAFFYFVTARLTWIPLYAVLLYAVWRRFGTRGLLWVVLFLGATVIADDQICNFFKHNVPKLRPTHTPGVESLVHTVRDYRGGLYGTVSAHAAISFSIALFTSVLFRRRWYAIAIFVWRPCWRTAGSIWACTIRWIFCSVCCSACRWRPSRSGFA